MKKGFTLIELLIALLLASIIFIVVFSLLITVANSNMKSKSQEAFEQTKNDLAVEISNVVRWGKTFSCNHCSCDPTSTQNAELTVDGNQYKVNGGAIEKNGARLTPAGVKITKLFVCDNSAARTFNGTEWLSPYPSYQVTIDMQSNLLHDTLTFIVSNRKQTISQ